MFLESCQPCGIASLKLKEGRYSATIGRLLYEYERHEDVGDFVDARKMLRFLE